MRLLVACAECKRQYDASGLAEGSRFHCHCGVALTVPRQTAHDAAVVRCASCSAPRTRGEPNCRHCGAEFTLHERDMHTICPSCLARVSDRARFCHHCATPLSPSGRAGTPSNRVCPSCAGERRLNSRDLGDPPLSVMECPRCAGIWLGVEAFQLLLERARQAALDPSVTEGGERGTAGCGGGGGPLYRRCPECKTPMHRRNYGKCSGVIVDSCKEHGMWFDAAELDRILHWVRAGGEETAAARERAAGRHRERQRRLDHLLPQHRQPDGRAAPGPQAREGDLLGSLLAGLFR